MKQILAIIGSPRKGETYHAVQKFEQEMKKYGEITFEYLFLRDVELKDCLGCHNCIQKGKEFCFEHKKIADIIDKIKNVSGVIISSPVYNGHISGLLKKLFDYVTYMWHRPELFGIKFMGIASGGAMFGALFNYMKTNVVNWGGIWVDSLGVPHYDSLTETYQKKLDNQFRKKARNFFNALDKNNRLPKPGMGRLFWFQMWKGNSVVCKESIPADYTYWSEKDWYKKEYYYDTSINPLKLFMVKQIMKLGGLYMKRIYKGY